MTTRIAVPPGPRGYPLIGSLPLLWQKPLSFYRTMSLDYGPISYATVAGARLYMVNEPSLIEELLLGSHKSCIKDRVTRSLYPLVGKGLLTSEHDLWRRQRKLASPPLQPKRISTYASTMVDCAQRTYGAFKDGETRDFHADSMQVTLEIAGKTLLGASTIDESKRIAHALDQARPYFEDRLYSWAAFVPSRVPLPSTLRFRAAKAELDRIVRSLIERSRKQAATADHLLARLLAARTEDGEAMSEQQLLDEALTMLLAGHETTALVLMFAVYALSERPEAAARLRAEVDAQLGTRAAGSDDIAQLPYADAVVRETMRLYPPAYAFGREVATEFSLGGFTLPVGSQVMVSPYGIHRNPRYFPEPDRFLPERWLGPEARTLPRMAYVPFGGGPRICIGNHFAMMEAVLLLATLAQQVELTVPAGFQLELSPVITLHSKRGMPVRVHKRPTRVSEQHASP